MATSPKNATNKQHAAFPTLFNRNGEARRIKGFRATREMFSRAIRMAKALDIAPRLMVFTPTGVMVLSVEATALLKEDGGVESLILNGFDIMPSTNDTIDHMIDEFVRDNKIVLSKQEDENEDSAEHERQRLIHGPNASL